MKKLTLLVLTSLFSMAVFAQITVSGTISDANNMLLAGVNIIEKGTSNGVISELDGSYSITVSEDAVLILSYVGYESQEISVNGQSTINVVLSEGFLLDAVQLVGSRNSKRTVTDTPVAIDIIDAQNVATQAGKMEINELLQYAAPSFNANKQ